MNTSLQKLVIIAQQGSSEDPFAEAETAKQFDDHLCSKGLPRRRQSKVFQRTGTINPAETLHQELEEVANHQGNRCGTRAREARGSTNRSEREERQTLQKRST